MCYDKQVKLLTQSFQTDFTYDVSAKTEGKMADFETFTLGISLNSSQMCTYFCKDLHGYMVIYTW